MTELERTIAYLQRREREDLLSPKGYERSKKRREVRAKTWKDVKNLLMAA